MYFFHCCFPLKKPPIFGHMFGHMFPPELGEYGLKTRVNNRQRPCDHRNPHFTPIQPQPHPNTEEPTQPLPEDHETGVVSDWGSAQQVDPSIAGDSLPSLLFHKPVIFGKYFRYFFPPLIVVRILSLTPTTLVLAIKVLIRTQIQPQPQQPSPGDPHCSPLPRSLCLWG